MGRPARTISAPCPACGPVTIAVVNVQVENHPEQPLICHQVLRCPRCYTAWRTEITASGGRDHVRDGAHRRAWTAHVDAVTETDVAQAHALLEGDGVAEAQVETWAREQRL